MPRRPSRSGRKPSDGRRLGPLTRAAQRAEFASEEPVWRLPSARASAGVAAAFGFGGAAGFGSRGPRLPLSDRFGCSLWRDGLRGSRLRRRGFWLRWWRRASRGLRLRQGCRLGGRGLRLRLGGRLRCGLWRYAPRGSRFRGRRFRFGSRFRWQPVSRPRVSRQPVSWQPVSRMPPWAWASPRSRQPGASKHPETPPSAWRSRFLRWVPRWAAPARP